MTVPPTLPLPPSPLATDTATAPPQQHQQNPTTSDPPIVNTVVDMTTLLQNSTPAVGSQRSAFAALHTAGSTAGYTGISSLTTNRSGSTSRRSRRTTTDEVQDADSDDADTDDEAGYQLNPDDGFWNNNSLNEEEVQVRDDNDDDASNTTPIVIDPPIPLTGAVPDLGALIAPCTDFPFTALTEEQANEWAAANPPQKLYNGESGLKRGVAATFDTPLQAFARSGFTPELIRKYTKNSNRYVATKTG